MNANICHLQVSHSQTLIQPRAWRWESEGGREMKHGEEGGLQMGESETNGEETHTHTYTHTYSFWVVLDNTINKEKENYLQ